MNEQKSAANLGGGMQALHREHGATLDSKGRVLELQREGNALRAQHGEPPKYPRILAGSKK